MFDEVTKSSDNNKHLHNYFFFPERLSLPCLNFRTPCKEFVCFSNWKPYFRHSWPARQYHDESNKILEMYGIKENFDSMFSKLEYGA